MESKYSAPHEASHRGGVEWALLKKYWIVKKRHPFGTLCELLSPLLCILLFAVLKSLDPDLAIPAGWATTNANRTAGTSNTTGSHWAFFSEVNLLHELISSVAGVGLQGVSEGITDKVSSSSSAPVPPPSQIASATDPSPPASGGAPLLSVASVLARLRIPRFFFQETTMAGLMINLAIQSLAVADGLEELSRDDLILCVSKFALLGFTSLHPTSLHYLPIECRGKVVPYKLAIAPDTIFTRQYMAVVMDEWYPRLPLLEPILGISPLYAPSFADSRMLFANESSLEVYLTSDAYGVDVNHPKIYAAVTFQEFPVDAADIGDTRGHDMAFTIRMNATASSSSVPNSVPRTKTRRYQTNKYIRGVKSQNTMSYATRGFFTLQTAVMRVLNCLPPWDHANERVLDAGVCQLTKSTVNDTSAEIDNRLLRQVEDDLVIHTFLRLAGEALKGVATPGSLGRFGNLSTVINQAMKQFSAPVLKATSIPDGSKRSLLRVLRQAPQPFLGASIFMSPTDAFYYGRFYDKVSVAFPILFLVSYLYGVSCVIVGLLMEKETRSREFMKILGIQDHQIIATWLVTYLQIFAVASLLQTVGASLLFHNSSSVLLFAFFFTFALSTFGFGFLVSAFFDRARTGSFTGMGLFFMTSFASLSFHESSTEAARMMGCLLSPLAFSQGVGILATLESAGVGLHFDNVSDEIGGFRFISTVYMQLLDFFLYVAVGWYVEKAIPTEHGMAPRWYVLVVRIKSWLRRQDSRAIDHRNDPADNEVSGAVLDGGDSTEEPVPAELKKQEHDGRAIVISQLRKVFNVPGGNKVAVRGLNLSLYEGQILCLLGHNGAGKTTLMSMLTGMTTPTSGDARIRGISILDGMHLIRQSLGYCPQYSVVYPELTVEEHLTLYANTKQRPIHSEPNGDVVSSMIHEVGLADKRHVRVHALSGGMKRKLSLAIAFLGSNRVVFLDEPTSGMDPYSRRSTWELIRRHKTGRIVILTTHFMDEADLLGDRIAIMADGELRCVGSSLFLKQRYGAGYRLSFVVKAVGCRQLGSEATIASVSTMRLIELVNGLIVEARLASDIGTEVTFQVPLQSSSKFPALFDSIDECKLELGIESYAIGVTTLEEIFLKVAELGRDTTKSKPVTTPLVAQKLRNVVSRTTETTSTSTTRPGCAKLFLIQLYGLLLKRFLSAKRDRSMLLYGTLLPVSILFASLSALSRSQYITNDPSVALTMAEQGLGANTPVPMACVEGGRKSEPWSSPWCQSTLALFPDASPSRIHIEPTVYGGDTAPTVFDLSYQNQTIDPSDSSGYCLRFAQLAFERGYAKDADSLAPLMTSPPASDQYGGLVLQATAHNQVLSYNVMVNSTAIHGAPTYKALADQAIHNFLLGNGSASAPFKRISVSTHPFPLPLKTQSTFTAAISLQSVLFVLIAFTFFPAAIMPFLAKEKQHESNARHQQLLSGVSLPAYWLANLLFDLLLYIVPMAAAIVLLRFYSITSSLGGTHADSKTCSDCTRDVPEAVVTLFILFGTAIIPWTCAMSHLMQDAGSCLLYTIMVNVVFGLVLQLTSFALDLFEASRGANVTLVFLWRCSPLFSFSNGLLRVLIADIEAMYGLRSESSSAFSTDVAGYEITYLAVQAPVFFVVALVVDLCKTGELATSGLDFCSWIGKWRCKGRKKWPRVKPRTREQREDKAVVAQTAGTTSIIDEDVCKERVRVLRATSQGDAKDVVRITELSKIYPNGKRALTNLSFGLDRGDCFGFLGINGAGKTTTMKILTGDLLPSHGSATLNGYDIVKQSALVRRSIGYCPQFDALLELLSVRENLELFGRLEGFTGKTLEGHVRKLIVQFQLDAFEHKLANSLSGGNKRKLSVAIAMLGDPELLFLDELSTGMDPFSRRFVWDIILRVSVQSRKSTIMLTTHSMEECEALCNRAGIMVGGKLQCFGTIPHLKDRFGEGFLLECKLETASAGFVGVVVDKLEPTGLVYRTDEGVLIDSSKLAVACKALASPDRVKCVLAYGSGIHGNHTADSGFHEQLQHSASSLEDVGSLDAHEFVAWWLLEDRVASLAMFLESHFGSHGSVVMVERQLDFCRFKLTPSRQTPTQTTVQPFTLARTFRLIEDARSELCIKEYSISQTSLEQIFNRFARQQEAQEFADEKLLPVGPDAPP